MKTLLLLFLFFVFTRCYLPGVAPKEYAFGETLGVKVNSLTSTKTQMPYEYYKLPLCKPKTILETAENLGEILIGDRIENSPYEVKIGVEEKCKLLCRQSMTQAESNLVAERIEEEYRVHWLVDNLPAATKRMTMDSSGKPTTVLEDGFMLGKRGKDINGGDPEKVYIHNHVKITILFNQDDEGKYRIVGVEVEPQSIAYDPQTTDLNCQRTAATLPQPVGEKDILPTITFTYSVSWESRSDIKWASRWDIYLLMTDDQIHWFSIINSLIIVFFLTGMVAMIMMRTLHADLRRYRESENLEDPQEETGWKLVHGDVFRPPSFPLLLSSLVGSGAQVFGMCVVTMLFAVLGFLSPANRGGLMTAMIVLFVVMGAFGGYFSARLYKLFKGQNWKQSTITTAFLFPGTIFFIFMILDIILAVQGSSGAVPFGTLVAIVALWFGISVPLVFLGSYFGFKKEADEMPVRTNAIPRQIPEQVWYMRPIFSILMGGILPFGAVFIELFFILSSIWLHQFYYLFGFLAIVFIILILTCAEITIVMCYFQLCSEDYHWWWRSFLTSGASAFFMFLYSVFYFFTKLQISQLAPIIVYFGYTTIMALGFFLLTGSIGFYACYFFVVKIYGSIKLE